MHRCVHHFTTTSRLQMQKVGKERETRNWLNVPKSIVFVCTFDYRCPSLWYLNPLMAKLLSRQFHLNNKMECFYFNRAFNGQELCVLKKGMCVLKEVNVQKCAVISKEMYRKLSTSLASSFTVGSRELLQWTNEKDGRVYSLYIWPYWFVHGRTRLSLLTSCKCDDDEQFWNNGVLFLAASWLCWKLLVRGACILLVQNLCEPRGNFLLPCSCNCLLSKILSAANYEFRVVFVFLFSLP